MKDGYYFYRSDSTGNKWDICLVSNGFVHFFGQVSQDIGNEYLTKYVTFGDRIETPKTFFRHWHKNIKRE